MAKTTLADLLSYGWSTLIQSGSCRQNGMWDQAALSRRRATLREQIARTRQTQHQSGNLLGTAISIHRWEGELACAYFYSQERSDSLFDHPGFNPTVTYTTPEIARMALARRLADEPRAA